MEKSLCLSFVNDEEEESGCGRANKKMMAMANWWHVS